MTFAKTRFITWFALGHEREMQGLVFAMSALIPANYFQLSHIKGTIENALVICIATFPRDKLLV